MQKNKKAPISTIIKIHFLISVLLLINSVLFLEQGISLSGQMSDKVLLWTWIGTMLFVLFNFYQKKIIQIYSFVLILVVFLSLLAMMIPFLSFFFYVTDFKGFPEIKKGNYRIQEVIRSPIAIPHLELVKSGQIYEKIIGSAPSHFYMEGESNWVEHCSEIIINESYKPDSIQVQFICSEECIFSIFSKE